MTPKEIPRPTSEARKARREASSGSIKRKRPQSEANEHLALSMSKKYDEYLKSEYWQLVSKAVKGRADFRCQVCNSQHDLQAHHRTYEHRGRELDHLSDLICMCRRCHGIFHGQLVPVAVSTPTPTKPTERPIREHKKTKGYVVPHEPVDKDMPEGESITLTKPLIRACMTSGTFTNATLRAFGVTRATMVAGWPSRLVGTILTRQQYRDALEGRFIYNSGRLI